MTITPFMAMMAVLAIVGIITYSLVAVHAYYFFE
jgi:hypothetical protein